MPTLVGKFLSVDGVKQATAIMPFGFIRNAVWRRDAVCCSEIGTTTRRGPSPKRVNHGANFLGAVDFVYMTDGCLLKSGGNSAC